MADDLCPTCENGREPHVPKAIPVSVHLTGMAQVEGPFKLVESEVEEKTKHPVYLYYESGRSFGFYSALELGEMENKERFPGKALVSVKHLACNSIGKGTCLITRTDYFRTWQDALNNLQGEWDAKKKRWVGKGQVGVRGGKLPEEMTEQQVLDYFGITPEMAKEANEKVLAEEQAAATSDQHA